MSLSKSCISNVEGGGGGGGGECVSGLSSGLNGADINIFCCQSVSQLALSVVMSSSYSGMGHM